MTLAAGAAEAAAPRLGPLARSILLHLAVLVALGAGTWWAAREPVPPPRPLAIEAVVVDASTLRSARPPPMPRPEPERDSAPPADPEPAPAPVPEPQPAPPRSGAAESAQRAEREAQQRRAAERLAEQKAAEQRAAAAKAAAEKAAAERAAAAKAAAAREAAAKEAAASEAASRAAEERAAAEAKLRAAREADLQRQLAAEENANRARASGQAAAWAAAIQARIQRAWIRPESARAGLDCTVVVNQVPGGEVTGVRITACNGDDVVRQSIEAAVYRASPLPAPPDPALFERTIEVRFRPNE